MINSNDPHPMEIALDIEIGSTMAALAKQNEEPARIEIPTIVDESTGELVTKKLEANDVEIAKEERYEDFKIEKQLDEIHGKAIDAFEAQLRMSQEADPKFSARNAEVAAQFLVTALNTVNSRIDSKYKRNKIHIARGNINKPNQIQNNIIVADRNSMLESILGKTVVEEKL